MATIDGDVCIGTETVNLCVMAAGDSSFDSMADAQLIAAAPELFEVVQEADTLSQAVSELLRGYCQDDQWALELFEQVNALRNNAQAAIDKATKGEKL